MPAFIRTPVADPAGVVVDGLLEEAMVVALPESAPLGRGWRRRRRGEFGRLAGETFIVYRRTPGRASYDAIFAPCHGRGQSPLGQEAPDRCDARTLWPRGWGCRSLPASLYACRWTGSRIAALTGRAAQGAFRWRAVAAIRRRWSGGSWRWCANRQDVSQGLIASADVVMLRRRNGRWSIVGRFIPASRNIDPCVIAGLGPPPDFRS